MATWEVQTPAVVAKREAERRELYGDEGFEERRAVAAARVADLEASPKYSHAQAIVFGNQFEPVAMGANDKHWSKLRGASMSMWVRLVCQISGVS